MPQAFRVMIPPGVGLLIGLIKDSSIVSVISYIELTRVGQILTEKTFLSFQVFGIVAALYFVLCYPLSRLAVYCGTEVEGRWLTSRASTSTSGTCTCSRT